MYSEAFIRGFQKRANFLGINPAHVMNYLNQKGIDPTILGAGVGALGGGAVGAATNKDHKLLGGLSGALAGAGLGGAAGLGAAGYYGGYQPTAVSPLTSDGFGSGLTDMVNSRGVA
jgi:hypothetical protein